MPPRSSPAAPASSTAGGTSQKTSAVTSITGTSAWSAGSSGNDRRPPRYTFFDHPSMSCPRFWYIRVSISRSANAKKTRRPCLR